MDQLRSFVSISRKVGSAIKDDIEPRGKTVALLSNLLVDDFDVGGIVGGSAKIGIARVVEHTCLLSKLDAMR